MIVTKQSRCPRRGLSLLEVLVALAIFLFSIVALHQALNIGTANAIDMQQHTQAAQLAQSKMAEVYVGAVPLTSQSDTPFDEDPDYSWSLDAQSNTLANLWNVTITVTRMQANGNKLEMKLSQMIIDPSIRGTSYDAAYTATLMPPSSTSSGSSSSGSSGGSSGSMAGGGGGAAGGGGGGGARGGAARGGAANGGRAGGGAANGGRAGGGAANGGRANGGRAGGGAPGGPGGGNAGGTGGNTGGGRGGGTGGGTGGGRGG